MLKVLEDAIGCQGVEELEALTLDTLAREGAMSRDTQFYAVGGHCVFRCSRPPSPEHGDRLVRACRPACGGRELSDAEERVTQVGRGWAPLLSWCRRRDAWSPPSG